MDLFFYYSSRYPRCFIKWQKYHFFLLRHLDQTFKPSKTNLNTL